MQDPDNREGYLANARTKPSLLLNGETPRLIDEWQIAPVIWDTVRHAVDERREKRIVGKHHWISIIGYGMTSTQVNLDVN